MWLREIGEEEAESIKTRVSSKKENQEYVYIYTEGSA